MPTYTYTAIHDPSANSGTYPYGINDAGQIVGYYDVVTLEPHIPVDHWHGFLYAGGTYITLDYPAAVYTYAYGINASGQIVGTYTNGPYHGFVYNGGTYTRTLDDPSATSITFAQGINASGEIVGYYQNSSTGYHGFLYSGGSYTTLDDSSGTAGSTLAHGINASGQIVGEYVDSGGTSHGLAAAPTPRSPIPSPSMAIPTTPTAPLHWASTMRARSSAIIMVIRPRPATAHPDTASSTAAASTPPSTIRRPTSWGPL
jgi:probable HAF family extracellular repeat protein